MTKLKRQQIGWLLILNDNIKNNGMNESEQHAKYLVASPTFHFEAKCPLSTLHRLNMQ